MKPLAREQVLLVDDDPDLLRLLTIRLGAAGYRVDTAESAEEALVRLAVRRPHLLITDLRMPGMDGLSLFETVHKTHPTLPCIILTAHGTIPDAVAAIHRGVFSFLTKPFDGKELLVHVDRALDVSPARVAPSSDAPDADIAWRTDIVTHSGAMEGMLEQARLVAASDAAVLIQGESGTGKELLARAIHRASARADKPFIAVNCSAIPETLLESELFGYAKGSFTGATHSHEGLFQAAHHGSLFLDEIGDMPLTVQAKLLRVLQDKQVRQVGSTRSMAVDVRVISATHRRLERAIEDGTFREDLYYRLNVVALEIPSLAQRREDVPLLALHFLGRMAARNKKDVRAFSAEAMELLVKAAWPGNVRQLLNVVEQAVVLSTSPVIPASLVQKALREGPSDVMSLREARTRFEQEYLIQLLRLTNGNVSQAARLAQRNRTEFYKLLHRHQINPLVFKPQSPPPGN